jgi:ABC-2 type transport system permease protein
MRKTYLVMRQELITTFKRPSYLVLAVGLPVLAVLVLGVIKLIQGQTTSTRETNISTPSNFQIAIEGYVDHAGIIHTISEDMRGRLIPFDTEQQAQQALQQGNITAYYIIPEDYLDHGNVQYVYPDGQSYLSDGQKWVIQWTLNLNLLDGDLELADQIWNPVWRLEERSPTPEIDEAITSGEDCTRPGNDCASNEFIRLIPSVMAVFFFFAFMSSSSMLFNSIGIEKENRTMELLMVSITPRQLLLGKTLALGIAGLTQTVIWLTAITVIFNLGGNTLKFPEGFVFPIEIMIWGILFFLGGFGLYASLMAGAGALVPKMKEAGIANYLAMSPLFLGYVFGVIAPLGGFADANFVIFLSFFPLTSPIVMLMRLTIERVPFWQVAIAASLVYVTAYYALQMVASMFHAQNLLSGQPFSAKRYFKALTGRA